MTASTAASEGIWLNRLPAEICAEVKLCPVKLGVDNQTAFVAAKNDILNGKAKHIVIREHFLRGQTQRNSEHRMFDIEKAAFSSKANHTTHTDGFARPTRELGRESFASDRLRIQMRIGMTRHRVSNTRSIERRMNAIAPPTAADTAFGEFELATIYNSRPQEKEAHPSDQTPAEQAVS